MKKKKLIVHEKTSQMIELQRNIIKKHGLNIDFLKSKGLYNYFTKNTRSKK